MWVRIVCGKSFFIVMQVRFLMRRFHIFVI